MFSNNCRADRSLASTERYGPLIDDDHAHPERGHSISRDFAQLAESLLINEWISSDFVNVYKTARIKKILQRFDSLSSLTLRQHQSGHCKAGC